jgi:hypothetical protein
MLAGVRSHGTLPRSDVQGIEYTFGGEKHIGLRTVFRTSALTRLEIGARATFTESDRVVSFEPLRTEHPTAFAPGRRIGFHFLAELPVRATSMLLFADFSRRAPGSVPGDPVSDAFGRPIVESPGRHVFSAALETRTPLRHLPVRLTLRARRIAHEDDPGGGWLGTAGIGTDVRIFGPWPGTLLLTPKATLHAGRIEVLEELESEVGGWGLTVTAVWRWR